MQKARNSDISLLRVDIIQTFAGAKVHKKMTLANKSAIFMNFWIFLSDFSHRFFMLSVSDDVLCFQYMLAFHIFQHGHLLDG